MTRHRAARRAPKPRPPARSTHQTPHSPLVPATTRDSAGESFGRRGSPLAHAATAIAGASHALELAALPNAGLADVILDLAGADHASLRQSLTAW